MTLTDVYDALKRYLDSGRIDLYAAAVAEPATLAGLREALDHYAIWSAFELTGANLQPPGSMIKLTDGKGSYGLGPEETRPAITATLEVTEEAGVFSFVLRFDFGAGRIGFATLFPDLLPDYEQLQANQSVEFARSYLYDLGLRVLRMAARNGTDSTVATNGLLDAEGILVKYKSLFPGWPLTITGSLSMPRAGRTDDPVAMSLTGIDKRVQIVFYNNQLTNVGLTLEAVRDLDPEVNLVTAVSSLELIGSLKFSTYDPVTLRVPLTSSGTTWRLIAELPAGLATIGNAISALAGLLGLQPDDLLRPIDFIGLDVFFLSTIEVAFAPPSGSFPLAETPIALASAAFTPTLRWLAITVRSDKTWTPPLPFVSIDRVGARWVVMWPDTASTSSVWGGSVFGGLSLGDSEQFDPVTGKPILFTLDVTALLPSFVVNGRLRQALTLPIGTALTRYVGSGTPPTPPGMSLTSFWFTADPNQRSFRAEAELNMDWALSPFRSIVFDLTGMSFFVDLSQSSVSAGLAASIRLDDQAAPNGLFPTISVGARAERAQGKTVWTFEGGLLPGAPLSLTRIAKRMLDVEVRDWPNFPEIRIDTLGFTVETGDQGYYAANGSASLLWSPKILDTDVRVAVTAGASVTKPTGGTASGTVAGSLALNRLAMSLSFDFGVPNPTWRFRVQFGEPWLELTTFTTQDQPPHRILTAQLGGVTLGSIIEYLVNLAAPTLGYRLDAPWDALNRVDLSRFLLSLDLTASSVTLSMNLPIDLGVMQISKLGLKYTRGAGLSGVELTLEGRFFGQQKALGWDVIRDPPPAVPGKGSLIDLYYLALGQRVRPQDQSPKTVRAFLDAMEKAMQPLPPGGNTPPPIGNGVEFAADSEWLIGLDIDLAETFRLGLLFNDPNLYGLSIALRGPKAGTFGGLDFQLLYKKISDTIGMFRIDLALPIAMRSFTFGPVGITLGTIALEVYTNGNFTIDFGYPWKRDFSRAFTLQYFPFIGRGGIYYGYLNGATSSRVPRITDGTFDPVIELGVGLAVGIGKEVVFGPLSGGAYVQIEVVFLGVFGWFNPTDHARDPAMYFWAQATAAIVGKVYGTVDFKVIKVSVSLMIEAEAMVTFEAYRAALFHIAVRVTAEAEIKILFIKISFSFKISLAFDFTAGSDSPTPWRVASGQGANLSRHARGTRLPSLRRSQQRRIAALAQTLARALQARGVLRAAGAYVLDFDPEAPIFAAGKQTLSLNLIPSFTLDGLPITWPGAAASDNREPNWRIALLLTAETGVDPGALDPAMRKVRQPTHALHTDSAEGEPAYLLCEAFLRWAIYAIVSADGTGASGLVTAAQMETLAEQLDLPETADRAFSLENLGKFFEHSLAWQIAGDPGGDTTVLDAMLLPLPPALNLAWDKPTPGSRILSDWQQIGADYIAGVAEYQQRFQPMQRDPASAPEATDDTLEAFATHAFRDYCLMLTKAAVKSARDTLTRAQVEISAPSSLAEIAARFPTVSVDYHVRGNDTLDEVAIALGATFEELRALNPGLAQALASAAPGSLIAVELGVAPALVALDNPDVKLTAGMRALGRVHANVREGDSFSAVASRFGLAGVAALATPGVLANVKLLGAGQPISSASTSYRFGADLAAGLGAAVFFARWYGTHGVTQADWYAQTLALWNAAALAGINPAGSIPAGTPLKVPNAYNDTAPPGMPNYTSLSGDTPLHIGAALALQQIYGSGSPADAPPGWLQFRNACSQNGRDINLPAALVAVQAGETLTMLGLRTLLHSRDDDVDAAALLGWLGSSPVLSPLALIEVDGAQVDSAKFASFSAISSALGLSLVEVGSALADTPGLLAASSADKVTLSISAVPVQRVDALVTDALAGNAVADLAGQVSRQTLSGLRLPAPVTEGGKIVAKGPLTAFVELTGQQIVGPEPGDDIEPGSGINLTVTGGAPWISFVGSTVTSGETVATLQNRHSDAAALNPGLIARAERNETLPAGLILRTGLVDELAYRYSAAELKARYPAPILALAPIEGPVALPLSALAPESFGLDHELILQTALPLALPGSQGALAGQPQLFPFPNGLRLLAHAGTPLEFEVIAGKPADSADGASSILPNATFGASVSVRIQRTESEPPLYTLIGSDADGREVLLDLVAHLGAGAVAYLAVVPDPAASDPVGLTIIDLTNAADAWLVRTNLSTASVPDDVSAAREKLRARVSASTTPLDSATLAAPAAFAQLLFEGSVVGGSGYFLSVTARDGGGLPASAFDSDGRAELRFIVLSSAAQQPAPGGRALEAFANCVLLAAGIDPSSQRLSVIATSDELGNAVATVPPGNAGFRMVLPNARPTALGAAAIDPTPTAQLFSLVDYTLGTPGAVFDAGIAGLPIYPQSERAPSWRAERAERRRRLRGEAPLAVDPNPDWIYEIVVPISRFAAGSAVPAVAGLPAPENDPYRGLGTAATRPDAQFAIGLRDVLGNASAAADAKTVAVNIGYTDPLLGPDGWPSTRLTYHVSGTAPDGRLGMRIDALPANLWPALSAPAGDAAIGARQQAERYQAIYYQWSQPKLELAASSSLFAADQPLSAGPAAAWSFAAAQYFNAATLAQASAVQPAATQSQLPGALVATYGMGLEHFAAANATAAARSILQDAALPMPAYVAMQDGDSADSLVARTPPGVLAPTAEALLNLDANSQRLPLRAGTLLASMARNATVAALDPTPSLAFYADQLGTTPGQLALDNTSQEILHAGFEFLIDGVALAVNYLPENGRLVRSFDEAVSAYADLGIHISSAELGEAVRDETSVLAVSSPLSSSHYQVPPPSAEHPFETLSDNGSGSSALQLAKLNTATRNLFDTGAMVYVGDFEQRQSVAPDDLATLFDWTQRFGTTPTQLLQRMDELAVPVPTASSLTVPGLLALPVSPSLRIGATVPATLQPQVLVARFEYGAGMLAPLAQFVTDNLGMPRLLNAGVRVEVSVGGKPHAVDTVAGDSFASVLGRLQAEDPVIDIALLATAIATSDALLTVGALISTPPALLDGELSSADAGLRYGTDPVALAATNIGLAGALRPGAELVHPNDPTRKQITVAQDSWNAVLARFADEGNHVDLAALVECNRTVVVYADRARLLLPVAPISVDLPLSSVNRVHPIFALQVALVSTRPQALIDPAFADSAVERVTSALQPAGGDADADSRLALATALRAALPELRLASGRAPDNDAELWLVDFSSNGIAKVDVTAQAPGRDGALWPRFYALRPLYPTLISRVGVTVPMVNSDGTISDSPALNDFVGIDVETWARRYLSDVDRLLSGPFASLLQRHAPAALTQALAAKRLLIGSDGGPISGATGVAAGLAPVLALQSVTPSGARRNAAITLAQALGANLSSAYASAGLVQYDTAVDSNWTRVPGTPGARLYGDGMPDPASPVAYTLTSARVDLTLASSTAEFILGLDRPAEHKSIAFAPGFRPTHLEWNIQTLPLDGNAGYVSSNWLTFIPAFTAEVLPAAVKLELGSSEAPIPLRAFPALPSVQAQSAGPSHPDSTKLDELGQWTYGFAYRHEHAAQDELVVNLTFNLPNSSGRANAVAGVDVATSLACYQTVNDTLFGLLTGATLANAAASLAKLMHDVAAAWTGHFGRVDAARANKLVGAVAGSFWLDVQLEYGGSGDIVSIRLTRLPDPGQPGSAPTAPGPDGAWPVLRYHAPDGSDHELIGDPVEPGALDRRYQFKDGPRPAAQWAQVELRYENLQIRSWQNATGSVAVVRNRSLVSGLQTDLDFVYASARVQAADLTTPLLRWTNAVEIGKGADPIAGLVAALNTLFGSSPDGQPISLAIGYGYELTPGLAPGSGLRTVIPVSLLPRREWSATIATALTEFIDDWQKTRTPATTDALYQFGLTLYSEQAPITSPPLLTIEEVIWRL